MHRDRVLRRLCKLRMVTPKFKFRAITGTLGRPQCELVVDSDDVSFLKNKPEDLLVRDWHAGTGFL